MGISVTQIIVGLTVLVSIGAFNNRELFGKLLHSPYIEVRDKDYYRFLSSGFIHADWIHLGINMFVLWQFGGIVEAYYKSRFGAELGGLYYLGLYFGAIIFGALPSYFKHKNNPSYRAIGASGGVSGVTLAYVVFQPWQNIYLYGIIGIPAVIAAILYLVYSSYAGKKNNDNIGHDAHFYGAVFGFIYTLVISPAFLTHFLIQLKEVPFI
ncbi:MAG TPA: rhomboid family intramembrane serine protease [Saprospiraceae bacterium]|nr:rhomboid family intramembrane serine protease [Saprospiraceae bacterium]